MHLAVENRTARGFSLVEVIIALFILGVMLILFQAVLRAGTLTRTAHENGTALSIARNHIEELRSLGYAALPASGTFGDDLVATLAYGATTTRVVTDLNAKVKQVTVSVIWHNPAYPASSTVSLSTLIADEGGLQ